MNTIANSNISSIKKKQMYNDMIKAGAYIESIKTIKRAREHGSDWCNVMTIIIKNGNLEILKYLHENGCPWDEDSCYNASENGNLEVLKYLHENNCPWNSNSSAAASHNKQLECLKYLHENGCPWNKGSFQFIMNDEEYVQIINLSAK